VESTRRNSYFVLGLVLIAFLVRGCNLSSQPYSNDEVIELEDARLPLSSIIWAADSFPPLFRLLLAVVLQTTDNDLAGRWMSVIFGTLCVPLVYRCGLRIGGRQVATVAALLSAFSPFLVYYSQEVRPYALYLLGAAAMLDSGLEALEQDDATSWVRFCIVAIVACYVHYYSSLFVTAIFAAWWIDRWSTRKWRRGLLAILGIAVGCVPALFLLVGDFAFTEDHSTVEVGVDVLALGYSFFSMLAGFTVGPSISALHEMTPAAALQAFLPSMIVTGMILVLPLLCGVWQLRTQSQSLWMLLFTALFPGFAAALLSALFDLNFNVRYVAVSAFPCLLLVAVGVANLRWRGLMILVTLAILTWFGIALVRRHTLPRYYNEDVRSAAAWLAAENLGNENVYVISDYMARTLRFYSRDAVPVMAFPDATGVMVQIDTEERLEVALARVAAESNAGCWFAVTRAYHGDPDRLFRTWLAKNQRAASAASFAGIEIFHWLPAR
jgi:hypothetical protein